jgi:acetyl-CoA carboxylase biotin carboxylase subunit
MFKKILIANRGEIALRVMRTCREMGISTVAVYSDADRGALHVKYADEAFRIGPPPSAESYLLGDKIIEICKQTGAEAVHPGYGFLSENANFARSLTENGITLIGPSPESMELMGSKLASKEAVADFGVPLVPGTKEAVEDPKEAMKIAREIGYPILIKASAGGGGKGMRVVESDDHLEEQMQLAINEAVSSFGDGAVFIEKYVASPRHIEIQIMADNHGNVCHLFERECSIQRRHQKLVEEAPSAVLTPELREEMGQAAVNVAKACNYSGAGTVEFLVDESLHFYFLEMNTRLQVEHPVTELVTGIDLVKEQLRVASGEKLSFAQEDLSINGHAFELRVCAEDPANNFLPDIGKLSTYKLPKGGGIRVDDCVEEGMEIPIYYDNMIAKLIVHADNREMAANKMLRAISEYQVSGITTTLSFGEFVFNHEEFLKGSFDTGFIAKYFEPSLLEKGSSDEELAAAIFASNYFNGKNTENKVSMNSQAAKSSNWYKNRKS